uniref:LO1b n=1 Tax=Barramundi adomavirus TaxID=2609870 RepID=A0A6F9F3I8_9VIRU|nr:TPA_asm: LO1b [Barramundi adomavirus]
MPRQLTMADDNPEDVLKQLEDKEEKEEDEKEQEDEEDEEEEEEEEQDQKEKQDDEKSGDEHDGELLPIDFKVMTVGDIKLLLKSYDEKNRKRKRDHK